MKPTLVRMDEDLRETLSRAAAINGRSLNMEVVIRLRDSVAGDRRSHAHGHRAEEAQPQAPGGAVLSDHQRMLIKRFDKLAPDKQLALLQLLAP